MILRDDPNYETVLGDIAVEISSNQIHTLAMGRIGLVNFWIKGLQDTFAPKPIGPISLKHFKQDVDYIITRIMGIDFE